MRLLADANVEAAIVSWLREQGCDVLWAVDLSAALPDAEVLRIAREEGRVLLTNDTDFGTIVFRGGLVSAGIVLLRFEAALQAERLALFQSHWAAIKAHANGHFVVVSDQKFRVRPLPPQSG